MEDKDYISDEILAAYLDGNTNEPETLEVLNAISGDAELREVLDIAVSMDDEAAPYNVLPMMALAAESGSGTKLENICSVLCEAYVLHRRGIAFDEKELYELAIANNWLTPKGTPLHAVGQLLAHYGQMVSRTYDATVDDISHALSLDNDVLVVVDGDKLYEGQEDLEDAPNHAVVVNGIDGDSLTIYDPQRNAQFSIPQSQFERSWKESHRYMVRVLQSADDYEPKPVNLDEIALTAELSELREAIAENAHDVWAAARIKEGWTYGPQRDDAQKKHPDLIPYSALPDSEKEYDRRMALDTIKLVRKLGFDIVKPEDFRTLHRHNQKGT